MRLVAWIGVVSLVAIMAAEAQQAEGVDTRLAQARHEVERVEDYLKRDAARYGVPIPQDMSAGIGMLKAKIIEWEAKLGAAPTEADTLAAETFLGQCRRAQSGLRLAQNTFRLLARVPRQYAAVEDSPYAVKLRETLEAKLAQETSHFTMLADGRKSEWSALEATAMSSRVQLLTEGLALLQMEQRALLSTPGVKDTDIAREFSAAVKDSLKSLDTRLAELDAWRGGGDRPEWQRDYRPHEQPIYYWRNLLRLAAERTLVAREFAELRKSPLFACYEQAIQAEEAQVRKLLQPGLDAATRRRLDREYRACAGNRGQVSGALYAVRELGGYRERLDELVNQPELAKTDIAARYKGLLDEAAEAENAFAAACGGTADDRLAAAVMARQLAFGKLEQLHEEAAFLSEQAGRTRGWEPHRGKPEVAELISEYEKEMAAWKAAMAEATDARSSQAQALQAAETARIKAERADERASEISEAALRAADKARQLARAIAEKIEAAGE